MSIKKTLCMLIALAMISPMAMAKKKKGKDESAAAKKPAAVKFVSITEDSIVVLEKGNETTYTITEDTKIFNKDGEEVGVADVDFSKVILDKNGDTVSKITEAGGSAAKGGASDAAAKKSKKKKKGGAE